MQKAFWKSKQFWTQVFGFLAATLTAVLPVEYKEVLMSGIALATAILTIAFRWNSEVVPLGFSDKK